MNGRLSRYSGLLGELQIDITQPRHFNLVLVLACVEKIEDDSFFFRDIDSGIEFKVSFDSRNFRFYPFDKSYPALVGPLEVQ